MKTSPDFQRPSLPLFFSLAIVIFFCTLSAADSIGFVPYYIDGTEPSTARTSDAHVALSDLPQLGASTSSATVLPNRIAILTAHIDLPVQNPDTRDLDTLDALLQKGPARYVDSAALGSTGTVLIFAHSSHLPIVHNQMFRAFNNIPDLQTGDQISLTGSDGKTYTYQVTSVHKTDTTDTTNLLAPTDTPKLLLVTCDTLTGKSARFVLQADFVGVQ